MADSTYGLGLSLAGSSAMTEVGSSSSGERMLITMDEVCAFLEDSADTSNPNAVDSSILASCPQLFDDPAEPGSDLGLSINLSAAVGDGAPGPSMSATTAATVLMAETADGDVSESPAKKQRGGSSHQCTWPGCDKGFSSRWTLERHLKNHQPTPGEQEPKPDSFVERRLRERLKSVQQALEKAKEKLAQHNRQQEQADAELAEVRRISQQQQAEIQLLTTHNQRRYALLPPGHPGFSNCLAAAPQAPSASSSGLSMAPAAMPMHTGGMQMAAGGMAMAPGGMAISAAGMAMTAGGMAMPTGGMQMATGGMPMPSGGMAMATGGMCTASLPMGGITMAGIPMAAGIPMTTGMNGVNMANLAASPSPTACMCCSSVATTTTTTAPVLPQ